MTSSITALFSVLWLAQLASGENMVFPADGGVIDVTRPPYSAKGDGKADDTKAIQAALSASVSANTIVYLPNGVYLVTDTLQWPFRANASGKPDESTYMKRTILQGQSRNGTVIRLRDRAAGFSNPAQPRAVLYTGRAPAQRFRNAIRNLTVNTGRENPGAVGVQFIANNQGTVRMVAIRSEDGRGVAGLDMRYTNEVGPCLIQDLAVTGYDLGIWTGNRVDSQTFERVTLENQNVYGIRNDGQVISVKGLESHNAVPAVYNASGFLTLLNAKLIGRGPARDVASIWNTGALFVRDLIAPEYGSAIRNDPDGGTKSTVKSPVREFVSHPVQKLFPGPDNSLGLKVEETPSVNWDALSEWANPVAFGANATDDRDDTDAIQAAIDSGKTTVYLPNGTFVINGTLHIRGNVRRIIGLEGRLKGRGTILFEDGTAPAVVMERFEISYSPLTIVHAASRSLVLSSATISAYRNTGRGKLFIEDVVGGPFAFKGQSVWARQLNVENAPEGEFDYKILNRAGNLWILGLKTEREGYVVKTLNGGATEIAGGFIYSNHRSPTVFPMLGNFDSSVTAAVSECTFGDRHTYGTLVSETRAGITKKLLHDDAPPSGCSRGRMLPLYIGVPAKQESSK